ncbi:hypothetical protein MIT9_P0400 [Methylomarinovum caldicuralii]|uniref:DNA gyrase subunit B n=1 Tax=Methylomarinovum caldicuralii TaxID=438856 RepID=A0AAU9C8Q4_9GAMM|nr:hypothetical protein [Methylomarinovum caldicuralii]BCX80824.1 hypothetical protein MIT9_P0400 [Methylomarinovum caldicuralii]
MSRRPGRGWWLAVLVALTLLYPLLVWLSLGRIDPRWLLLALLGLMGLRAWWLRGGWPFWALTLAVAGLLLWGREGSLLLYPVLVNGVFLVWFLASLWWFPPPVVERLARLLDPDLPPEGVRYTRTVTWVWCLFFAVNGAIAAFTVWYGDLRLWTFYNGLLAYLLSGALMAVEYGVRRWTMRRNGHA